MSDRLLRDLRHQSYWTINQFLFILRPHTCTFDRFAQKRTT